MIPLAAMVAGYWLARDADRSDDEWTSDPLSDPLGQSVPVDLDEDDDGYLLIPDFVEDTVERVYTDGVQMVTRGLDRLPEAAGRFGAMSAGTLAVTGALTALTLWGGWKLYTARG